MLILMISWLLSNYSGRLRSQVKGGEILISIRGRKPQVIFYLPTLVSADLCSRYIPRVAQYDFNLQSTEYLVETPFDNSLLVSSRSVPTGSILKFFKNMSKVLYLRD